MSHHKYRALTKTSNVFLFYVFSILHIIVQLLRTTLKIAKQLDTFEKVENLRFFKIFGLRIGELTTYMLPLYNSKIILTHMFDKLIVNWI